MKLSGRYVVKTKDSEVQTGLDIGLHYHWVNSTPDEVRINARYKEAFAEPSSVGTSVVNADTLNGMLFPSITTISRLQGVNLTWLSRARLTV